MPKNRKILLSGLAVVALAGVCLLTTKEMGASDSGFIDTPVEEQVAEVTMEDNTSEDVQGEVTEEVVNEETEEQIQEKTEEVTEEEVVTEDKTVTEEPEKEAPVVEQGKFEEPTISFGKSRNNSVFALNSDPNWLEGVSAIDKFDGDLSKKIDVDASDVRMDKPGTYKVIYRVYNSKGQLASVVRNVTVK